MSHEVSKPVGSPIPTSENFHNDDEFATAQSPLRLVQSIVESPDVTQKKLLSEIRKLTLKVSELEDFCDDCESEKQEILRAKLEHERKISLLEEKCRVKEMELIELRDTCNELHICQIDNGKMREEIERLVAALKSSQEANEVVVVLKKENDELTKKNTMLDSKAKFLESEVAKWKANKEWKEQYEQVKDALEKAERELFQFVKDSESTKAASELELISSRQNHSQSSQWATISRARCTCTCHHNSFRLSQHIENPGSLSASGGGVGNFCTTSSPSFQLLESTQNMGEISVVDVSLWRDTRTSSTQSDAAGECLGEVMAQDVKIQDLQSHLNAARNEVDHLNVELSEVSAQYTNLLNKYTLEQENLGAQIRGLNLEKKNLLTDLEEKCLALETVSNEVSTLSSQLKTTSSELDAMKTKADQLKDELDHASHKLDESEMDKVGLRDKLNCLERELAQFSAREKEFEEVKLALEEQLTDTHAEMRSLRSENQETVAALEMKVDNLMSELLETQNRLNSNEVLRIELSDRLDSLQKEERRLGEDKVVLSRQLALSKKAADDFGVRLQEAVTDLEEKVSLVEHLKLERVKLIEARDTALEEVAKLKSELSRAWEEVACLSNELKDNDNADMRIEQLESSLRTRDSNIASLNQLICENDAVISRLTEERGRLEEITCTLKVDLEAQTSKCNLLVEERDKTQNDCDKRTREITDEKNCFLRHMKALETDIVEHTRVNRELSEKCTATEQEVSDLQQKLSLAQEEVIRISETNQCLIDDSAKLTNEKVNLKRALSEESSLVASLRDKNDALTKEVFKLKSDVEKYQQEIAEVCDEKTTMTKKIESCTVESINLEKQLVDLRSQLAFVTADQERLVGSNRELSEAMAVMEADRSRLESQLCEMRQQYAELFAVRAQYEEVKHMLEANLKRLRTDLLAAEQRMAEARQSASVAALHRQFAENECSRLTKFIEGLELRLDAATTERLACEERVAAEAVRCRQLEGALNEKETIISCLQHQLNQLDAHRKAAQEKEASTLIKYLKSKTAQDEAERRLALLESGSSIIEDKKKFGSLDHISYTPTSTEVVLTSTTMSEFPNLSSVRRHSDGTASCILLKGCNHHERPSDALRSDADRGSPVGERSHLSKLHFENEVKCSQSPLFGDMFPLPHQDVFFKTLDAEAVIRPQNGKSSGLETREVTLTSCVGEEKDHAVETGTASLHVTYNNDLALCTSPSEQEADALSDKNWPVVSPIIPQEFEQSSSNNVLATKKPVHVAETVEIPRCASAASNATNNTDTDTVSELEGWPPYGKCTAPLSPQALRGNRIFTVPTPFEFHYRRLRRLLIVPVAEEMDVETAANNLETKSILAENPCSSVDGHVHSNNRVVTPRRQNQTNRPVDVSTNVGLTSTEISTPRTTVQIKSPSKTELRVPRETTQRDNLLSRTPSQKPNIGGCCEFETLEGRRVVVDPTASRSTSTSRPPAAKLARFQSVQKLCDLDATPSPLRFSTSMNALDRVAAGRMQTTAPTPPGFRRFKNKFGKVRGHKAGTGEAPVMSGRSPYWSDKENAEMNQLARTLSVSSVKPKKHNKLRLSNVFKSKKSKP
ncbi:hypothetical protein TcWFU_003817 [Taenia crassiceps]|uniref:Uncharacterized protein n=1 Tax=Taenia crassiceps TaxID=6207 RepID=A0ABR4QDB7_9CEST